MKKKSSQSPEKKGPGIVKAFFDLETLAIYIFEKGGTKPYN